MVIITFHLYFYYLNHYSKLDIIEIYFLFLITVFSVFTYMTIKSQAVVMSWKTRFATSVAE